MKNKSRSIIPILIGGSCIIAPILLQILLGEKQTYWSVLCSLVVILGIVFGGWVIYGEYYKLKGQKRNGEGTHRFLFYKTLLGTLFWAFLICCVASCEYNYIGINEELDKSEHLTVWNAENIPLPHLADANQYVSNPDTLLNINTQDSINYLLRKLDKEFGIETAVIVVKNIENADAFRMAQDVGNKFGVGNKETNRGLIIVVAYNDHKYFIAPGMGLEGDLTDAECNQLARQYLTPNLKTENPNEAMLQFITALYNSLNGKKLPRGTTIQKEKQYTKDTGIDEKGITFIIMIFWLVLYARLNDKYKWINFSNNNGTGYTGFGRDRTAGTTHSYWGTMWPENFGRGSWNSDGGIGGYGGGSFGGGGAGGSW